MGKCGIAKILFYAYSLILLVGYALLAVVNYYPPAQSIVLKEGARVKLSYVALQNSQPPLITIERESGQAKLHAASVESSPDDMQKRSTCAAADRYPLFGLRGYADWVKPYRSGNLVFAS